MNKKNILLLINQLYGGGAQKVIANLSIQLSPLFNVTLVVYNDIDKIIFPYDGELVKINLPYSDNTHTNSFVKRVVRFIALIRQVKKIKRERQTDVCISFLEASNIINILSSGKEKTILSVRSYLSNEFKDHKRLRIFKSFIKQLYKKADHIIVPSQLVKKDLKDNFRVPEQKISLIYNYIERELIKRLMQEPIIPHLELLFLKKPVVINVGRITTPKAQWLLPGVLKKVKSRIPNAKLMILGEGPLKEELMRRADGLNLAVYEEGTTQLSENSEILKYDIFLLGFTANPFPYLAKSQVFIKSSIYEGFPNVIIEAMESGLPVISSDCASGPREILSPDTDINIKAETLEFAEYGILVPPYDNIQDHEYLYINPAAEAVITVLSNDEKRKHYQERSLLRSREYEKDIILKQWIELID